MLMFPLVFPPPSWFPSCVLVVAVVTFPCCFPLQHEIVCMLRAIKHNNDAASKFRINTKLFLPPLLPSFLPWLFQSPPPSPSSSAAFHLFPNAVKAALENDFTHLSHRVRREK